MTAVMTRTLHLLAASVSTVLLLVTSSQAQQQTVISFSNSQGRARVSSAKVLSQSVAASNAVDAASDSIQLFLNVRPVVRPDGSLAYEIINPDEAFSSYAQDVTRSREQRSSSAVVTNFSSFGYSVFHP